MGPVDVVLSEGFFVGPCCVWLWPVCSGVLPISRWQQRLLPSGWVQQHELAAPGGGGDV